ncbi:urease accessory protein UreH domain-containing protein [Nonomuraea wenchangensis]|uniref:Sulfite exporter TauE/SafE n=1 Tax=Nonomuraea wenchangensis TaxID=568860 RepID=A0A1I0F892_9ACTN|nr:sulfite exporter TauE/SafE family protein [Nonomuraea wenchangensis]SET54095.1 Sulfite exporter TauE/SafE [Nonomuraea wenchangensis]
MAAGLVAGTATCAATQGGLLVGLVGRGGDRAAVGWFLGGRLVSYTVAGALLGLLGSAVSLPPPARAALLVAAGVVVVGFAVRMLRRGHCAAPGDGGEVPRLKAPLLGAATILVPCGMTLGVEMIAVSSGSPLAGAAAMAGFVLGTAPAFALLGYVLRRVSRTRLSRVAGVIAIAAGVWTAGTGLNLAGWLPAAAPATGPAVGPAVPAAGPAVVTVWATRTGYRPFLVTVPAGVPVEIDFRVAEPGCTGTVVIAGRDVALPATVRLPPQPPGRLRYACGMGMFTGFLDFR